MVTKDKAIFSVLEPHKPVEVHLVLSLFSNNIAFCHFKIK